MIYMSNGKTNLASYNCNWHNCGGSGLKIKIWYFFNALFLKNPLCPFMGIKRHMLRLFGAKIGKGVWIKPGVNVKYPWNLTIGNNVWIGENVWIENNEPVSIGDNVVISQKAMLLCGNHNYKKTTFDLMVGKITLEDGSWVGAGAMVCPGVTLRSHAVLTVCSVATKDLEAYSIYQGNPAVKVRDRIIE